MDVTDVPQPGPWAKHGRCAAHPELTPHFFPESGEDTSHAVAICRPCPVRGECLAYALEYPQLQGIWGGTSHRERHRLGRRVA